MKGECGKKKDWTLHGFSKNGANEEKGGDEEQTRQGDEHIGAKK
jgi:hypothetical protein